MFVRALVLALVLGAVAAGCGSSSSPSSSASGTKSTPPTRSNKPVHEPSAAPLHFSRALPPLPAARSGIAAASFGSSIIVSDGLSDAGTSTDTVFRTGQTATATATALPGPVHDAAATEVGGRLLLFGGLREGVFTTAILSWAPGERRWRAAGRLPVALADAGAVPFGAGIAVAGGRGSAGKVASVSLMSAG